MTTLLQTATSRDTSSSRARAAMHFFARSSCCKHNLPVKQGPDCQYCKYILLPNHHNPAYSLLWVKYEPRKESGSKQGNKQETHAEIWWAICTISQRNDTSRSSSKLHLDLYCGSLCQIPSFRELFLCTGYYSKQLKRTAPAVIGRHPPLKVSLNQLNIK